MDKLLARWNIQAQDVFMYSFAVLILASILTAVRYETNIYALLPFGVLVAYLCVVDFRKVFFLLLFSLPFSMETELPGGFSTDLPSEPLVLILLGVYLLFFIKNLSTFKRHFFYHPLTVLLGFHFLWTTVCTLMSSDSFVSLKFLLAKFWYIVVYFFMAGLLLKNKEAFRTMIWCVSIALSITVIYVMFRHSGHGFSFDTINLSVGPFYRNHVSYAAIMALFVPFMWYLRLNYPKGSKQRKYLFGMLVIVILGIILAYTRAAYLALIAAMGAYWIVRFKLMRLVLVSAIIGSVFFTSYLLVDNKYTDYAPNFEKTIAHKDFDNLVSATAKGEDVSVMERFYRWIAGVYMIEERPVFGFGPGNFHGFYKGYTVNSFKTYVSDNPEKSGIHSYFLMLGVEQGIPGIIFFVLILLYFFYRIEIVYHRETDPFIQGIIMAIFMCMIVITLLLLLNDMIETDKVGSFFFICLAILINIDIQQKKKRNPQIS